MFKKYILQEKYQNTYENDDENIKAIIYSIVSSIISNFFDLKSISPKILNSGKNGYVIDLTSENMINSIHKFEEKMNLSKIKKSSTIPNRVAMKVQIYSTKNQESIILHQENILLSDDSDIKKYIPAFYYGCTLQTPFLKNKTYIRITFTEIIDFKYIPILQLLEVKNKMPILHICEILNNLLIMLSKNGIDKNNIDIQNIVIDCFDFNTIKIEFINYKEKFENNITTISELLDKLSTQ
jgi:hypothetical protein